MKRNTIVLIGFLIILIALGLALIAFVNCLAQKSYITENVLIALIAALSTIITITGAVFTNKFLTNEELQKDKEMEFLKIKREFYHEFLEQFLMQLAYQNDGLLYTDEAKENENKILISKIRLPLYASKELIEYFEKSDSVQSDLSEMYRLIRNDLMESNLNGLDGLKQISVYLPKIVISDNIKKQNERIKADYQIFKTSELFNTFIQFISVDANLTNGLVLTNENNINMNKLRMLKIVDYVSEKNVFRLSLTGINYLNLYKLDNLYSANG